MNTAAKATRAPWLIAPAILLTLFVAAAVWLTRPTPFEHSCWDRGGHVVAVESLTDPQLKVDYCVTDDGNMIDFRQR